MIRHGVLDCKRVKAVAGVTPALTINPYAGTWDEYGTCCATSGPTIQCDISCNTNWTAVASNSWVTSSINSGSGNGYTDIGMDPDELGPGRNGTVTFSVTGIADVIFYANQMGTGMTCG